MFIYRQELVLVIIAEENEKKYDMNAFEKYNDDLFILFSDYLLLIFFIFYKIFYIQKI